jgi:segregation and condensation protein A
VVSAAPPAFEVHLDVFDGPFDLLLSLIAKAKLDVTEVALSKVTDDFLAHLRARPELDLEQTSEFLVVAATLLDLKAARLLPAAEVEDEEDLALLDARDLLFARLLQYRAYKAVAAVFAERWAEEIRRVPRPGGVEPQLRALRRPELVLDVDPERLAALAARALSADRARPAPVVSTEHLHAPAVSVAEQAAVLAARLRRVGVGSFRSLVLGCDPAHVVARFLALLDLYRAGALTFDQPVPMGELSVRWTAPEDVDPLTAAELAPVGGPGTGEPDPAAVGGRPPG